MSTQVSFTADLDLKEKALAKAKKDGMTLKTILLYSMKAYVDGKIHFGIIGRNEDETEVEEIVFDDPGIQNKARKLANLLK